MRYKTSHHPCLWITLFILFGFSINIKASTFDSLRMERAGDRSYILHEVDQKETLFGISRRYQASVGDIVNANEVLKAGLKIGQTIRVPFISKSSLPTGISLHSVLAGETLFSISKKYGLAVDELMKANELKGNDLSVGQPLVIPNATVVSIPEVKSESAMKVASLAVNQAPVEKSQQVKVKPEPKQEEKKQTAPVTETTRTTNQATIQNNTPVVPGDWISHAVKPGETLFSISGQYGARVEDVITWNALTSNNLKEGQVLKVGKGQSEESKVPEIGAPGIVPDVSEMTIESTAENTSGGFKNLKELGQAELIEGTGGHKKYLVLHRSAPIGTIMRVKNEENNATIFARVVGTLPETGDNSKLVIKLSQAAFDQLKAVNGRFPVEIMY
jgi:LysM repeat protein